MAKLIFKETGNLTDKPRRAPFDLAAVQEAAKPAGTKLRWFNDDTEPSWVPYCIRIVQLKNNILTFRFVHSDESQGGAEIAGDCTVNLERLQDVWPEHPSTIDRSLDGAPPAGKEYAFLFLSPAFAKTLPQSGMTTTESKWPRGSEWTQMIKRIFQQHPSILPSLPDADRRLLQLLGIGL